MSKAETVAIAAIEAGVPALFEARDIIAAFHAMIRRKAVSELPPWIERAREIAVLREHEAGAKTADLAREHGISEATLYNWKAKYDGLGVSEAKRLRLLEDENRKLKKLLAESMLNNAALKELLSKKW